MVIGDVLDDQSAALAKEINAKNARSVVAIHLDVTRGVDWRNAVATCEREFGGLDVLVTTPASSTPPASKRPARSCGTPSSTSIRRAYGSG